MPESDKAIAEMGLADLRKLVESLQTNFKRAVWGGTIVVSALSAVGLSKLSDIENKARERVDNAVTKGTEFFDLVLNGQSRMNASQWNTAIGYFESARSLKPEDEYIFYSLLLCYVNAGEIEAGSRLIGDAERAGLLNRKFNQTWTLLNAGRLYILLALTDEANLGKADYYLGRAERAAELQKGGDLSYVLYARAILEYIKGNMPAAESHINKLISIDPRARDWPSFDRPEPWFQLLLLRHPKLAEDFDRLLRAEKK